MDMKQRWFARLQSAGVAVILTLILVVLINGAALVILRGLARPRPGSTGTDIFLPPGSPEGLQVLRKIFPGSDDRALKALIDESPPLLAHPTLPYTIGFSRGPYLIGTESMRYEPGWTDAQVDGWLGETDRNIFVFGGSTTFGHGVPGDQTVVSYLNRLSGSENLYLNFGVPAYDSIREVDKLLDLLRKGYRPARVLFVDGLNDVSTFAWSSYSALEKPRTQGLLIDRGEVGLIFGYPRANNMVSAFAFSFPAVQLAFRLQSRFGGEVEVRPRRADRDLLNWQELMILYHNWDLLQFDHRRRLAEEVVQYYRENLRFLRLLAEAFEFRVQVVYQPIGLLQEDHPFHRAAFRDSRVQQIYRTVGQRVREAIQEGSLDMIDCSSSLSGESLSYVDSTHYSPRGNELLARCIRDGLEDSIAPGAETD